MTIKACPICGHVCEEVNTTWLWFEYGNNRYHFVCVRQLADAAKGIANAKVGDEDE